MLNQNDFNKLKAGDGFLHYCVLVKGEVKTAKNGRNFYYAEIKDKTALLVGRMWDGFEKFAGSAKEGDVTKVKGAVEEFQGNINIKIEDIRKVVDADNVGITDFLVVSERSLNEMVDELKAVINSVKNEHLNKLLKNVLVAENYEKFIHVPAGKSWHHSYISGLLEHTLEIIKICDLISTFHKEIRRDLLICGAVFHDFGKVKELSFNANFDYTDVGRLLGHIVLGAMDVEKAISTIKDFPENLKMELLHLILSHQGKLEFATPVEPKTIEAIVLYHADELSAKTNAYKYAIKSEENKAGNWTRFLPLANTSLYISRDDFN
ncbi:MAG: HD domain-containing protein [bacterium]